VRRDRLGVYGYGRPTTPRVDAWAADARVFDDCVSAASTTAPAHASLFTGLLPSEHGADNEEHPQLDRGLTTLAEILQHLGYATYMFSANPHVSGTFAQGFDVAEHPWDAQYRDEALRITREKLAPEDESTELPGRMATGRLGAWNIKTAGALAQKGVEAWLAKQPADQPVFIVINYMEAHRPLIPPRSYRELFMTPEQVAASYKVDRTWESVWEYTFGLKEFTPEELALTSLTYDAAVRELDDLFGNLLDALGAAGRVDGAVVALTSDHGEHLGEHHLLDHQFSVYEELLRVPLIVRAADALPAGREPRPVVNMDLFPTLLALAGLEKEHIPASTARSLLSPPERRYRLAEYPAPNREAIRRVRRAHADFDSRPWERSLRAFYKESYKLIAPSDERYELYDLGADPAESTNLAALLPNQQNFMLRSLGFLLNGLSRKQAPEPLQGLTEEQRRELGALGYTGGSEAEETPESDKP